MSGKAAIEKWWRSRNGHTSKSSGTESSHGPTDNDRLGAGDTRIDVDSGADEPILDPNERDRRYRWARGLGYFNRSGMSKYS